MNIIIKQLTFLIIPLLHFWKNIAQISSHSLWPDQFMFTSFYISTLYLSVAWLGIDLRFMDTKDICVESRIGLRAQNLLTILGSLASVIGGIYKIILWF
jgi:hypothetical protein